MILDHQNIPMFLKELSNEREDFERAFIFLHHLQKKTLQEPVPLLELLTVIKVEKPLVYNYLKTRCKSIPVLNLMFELSLDYNLAKERLGLG